MVIKFLNPKDALNKKANNLELEEEKKKEKMGKGQARKKHSKQNKDKSTNTTGNTQCVQNKIITMIMTLLEFKKIQTYHSG